MLRILTVRAGGIDQIFYCHQSKISKTFGQNLKVLVKSPARANRLIKHALVLLYWSISFEEHVSIIQGSMTLVKHSVKISVRHKPSTGIS